MTRIFKSDRHTAWFIDVHLHALISSSNQIQWFIVPMKIGFSFSLVRQLISFYSSDLTFLCSQSRKGMRRIVTVVNLQELRVKLSDRTSPMSQHGTKDANRELRKSTAHAKNELISIVSLNSSSSEASSRLILSSRRMNILRLLPFSTLYMALLVPMMLDCRAMAESSVRVSIDISNEPRRII